MCPFFSGVGYGLGFRTSETRSGSLSGHTGSNIGWKLRFATLDLGERPSEGLVVLTNSETGSELGIQVSIFFRSNMAHCVHTTTLDFR